MELPGVSFFVRVGLLAALMSWDVGCSAPADPNGTLERATRGTVRVGYLRNPPFASARSMGDPAMGDPATRQPEGIDLSLFQQLAEELQSEARFEEGTESELFHRMHQGELDLVLGGVTREPPWERYVSFTRPYFEQQLPEGRTAQYVWAVPLGENGWLYTLENFLDRKRPDISAQLEQELHP